MHYKSGQLTLDPNDLSRWRNSRYASWMARFAIAASYKAQATQLQQALGIDARVRSVVKRQGQEAPIVYLSMCSSDSMSFPRGMHLLFDRNRLNMAVSRAETLCVVVGHPGLAVTPVETLADLKRVNFVGALMGGGIPPTSATLQRS